VNSLPTRVHTAQHATQAGSRASREARRSSRFRFGSIAMSDEASPSPPVSFEHGDAVGPVILGLGGTLLVLAMVMYIAREPERAWPEYFAHRAKAKRRETMQMLFQRTVAEFIGTFFVVVTIELTAGQSRAPLAPLAIGSALMAMTFAFGHVSGAHFNPAITLSVFVRGKIEPIPAFAYLAAQLIGAFGGAAVELITVGDSCINAPLGDPGRCGAGFPFKSFLYHDDPGVPFLTEFLYTFMLCTVYLNVASSRAQEHNSFFGLAVGFALMVGAVAAGDISGGCFNPAVGTALPAIHGNHQSIWLYWIPPCLGAALASVIFRFVTSLSDDYIDSQQEIMEISARQLSAR